MLPYPAWFVALVESPIGDTVSDPSATTQVRRRGLRRAVGYGLIRLGRALSAPHGSRATLADRYAAR